MHSSRFQFFLILNALRRRIRFIVIPTALVSAICIVGAFVLPKKYESSTTILVRPDQTLNPLMGYEMAMAFEEQLRNFNEIVYSSTLLQQLADSLGMLSRGMTEAQKLKIMDAVKNNLSTSRTLSNSFKIGYVDTDPVRAQLAARVITNLFIQTKISMENKQNQLTVEFYEKKVEEYRQAFEVKAAVLVSAMKENVKELPFQSAGLYTQINDIEKELFDVTGDLKGARRSKDGLAKLLGKMRSDDRPRWTVQRKQGLYEVLTEDLPFVDELRALLVRHDEMSLNYTENHPEVQKLETLIDSHVGRVQKALESQIGSLQVQQAGLEARRAQIIEELKKMSALSKMSEEQKSNYEVSHKLYDDMNSKLEQARLAQEVGSRGANQYVVIDPAFLPIYPSKPKRIMITLLGFGSGLLLGLMLAGAAEFLDTTLRTPRDVEIYEKPIIALLPEGNSYAG